METCLSPIVAVSTFINKQGKHHLRFLSKSELLHTNLSELKSSYGSENVFLLPCMRCDPCRKNYAHDWSLRCTLESEFHCFNYFITLTYNNIFVKRSCLKDFQMFIDRLQKYDPNLKYFACQEFGEINGRFHWHLILFTDYDLQLHSPVLIGKFLHYHSSVLSRQWYFGIHDISLFDPDCASYVAKYTGKGSKVYMSRNLGKIYFDTYLYDLLKNDLKLYILNNGSTKIASYPPKCFYKWLKQLNIETIDYKSRRLLKQKHFASLSMYSLGASHEEEVLIDNQIKSKRNCKGVRSL